MAGTITGTTVTHRPRGLVQVKATITVDASGNATAAIVGEAYGRIVGVSYAPGTLATGADITITDSDSGATLFVLTDAGATPRFFRPTQVVTSNVGVAITAATTAVDVNRDVYIAGKIKVAVAQGGVSTSGVLRLFVEE